MSFQGYYGVVVGTIYYHIQNFPTIRINMMIYNQGTDTLSVSANPFDVLIYTIPANTSLWGCAYDGSNLILFVLQKVSDSLNYLIEYSITGDTFTIVAEYDISIMLDRNVNGSSEPFTQEKAFNISDGKIYQFFSRNKFNLQYISDYFNENSITIVALTDHFAIDSNGNIYEFKKFNLKGYF